MGYKEPGCQISWKVTSNKISANQKARARRTQNASQYGTAIQTPIQQENHPIQHRTTLIGYDAWYILDSLMPNRYSVVPICVSTPDAIWTRHWNRVAIPFGPSTNSRKKQKTPGHQGEMIGKHRYVKKPEKKSKRKSKIETNTRKSQNLRQTLFFSPS